MVNEKEKHPKAVKVQYTIQDGEYEYGDSFMMQDEGEKTEEQALRELAGYYACDAEEEQEIIAALQSEGMSMIGNRAIKNVSVKEVVPVLVIVRGGVIQDIQNIPEGITIQVQDYDIDGLTTEELGDLGQDEEGNPCHIAIWENS